MSDPVLRAQPCPAGPKGVVRVDPVLRATNCPPGLLPASARSFLKLALECGWDAHASVAIGPPDDADLAVMSVVVWARWPVETSLRVSARWECPSDRSRPFGFAKAWRLPGVHGIPDALNFNEAKAALKGE